MNDGTISATPTNTPSQQSASQPVIVKVETLPPEIPPNTVVSGEVTSVDKNQVSIKTDQGVIVLDAALDLIVGQKINLKIQQVIQQSIPVPVAELLNVSDKVVIRPADGAVKPPPVQINPVMQDPVIVHDPSPFEEYKPFQAMVMQMPNILNDETLDVLIKTITNLPIQNPLPPSLKEGFEKFNQLTALLSQANLLPTNEVKTTSQPVGIQQNIITSLQQALQNITGKNASSNPLLNQTPHQFIQLQAIQPGQNLSPNILVNIKQQLMTLLQSPQSIPSFPVPTQTAQTKPAGIISTIMPNSLMGLIEKAGNMMQASLHPSLGNNFVTPEGKQLFTAPMLGLVLGAAPQQIPQMKNANLILMLMPGNASPQQGQQLIGMIAPQQQSEGSHQSLLPGAIIVAAVQPQEQKTLNFTILPENLTSKLMETFLPLHASLGDEWPALDEVWQQALAQQLSQPDVLAALRQTIPSPTPQQMPPAMLFFLSVLKNGFTADWVGDKHLAALGKIDKATLIKTLSQDMQTIKSRMEENLPSDAWRPLPLPLQVGDQLMRLQWFYRHPEDEFRQSSEQDNEQQKKRKTRFLLNVPKTSVGDIQIDGLVQEMKLDIILRTENVLVSAMETAIRGRYAAALETTGMVGGIDFQSGKHHYVHV